MQGIASFLKHSLCSCTVICSSFQSAFSRLYFDTRAVDLQVLDLMVRMLGFSEEDKRRVGMAQQQSSRGGGMVRSVFGVPGRIVGGILGSSDSEATSPRASPGDNQVFCFPLPTNTLVKASVLLTHLNALEIYYS